MPVDRKIFHDVNVNVTIKPSETRALLSTDSEDIAVQLGKIQKWFPSLTSYGVCSTADSTGQKSVTVDGFVMTTGTMIAVKFTTTNTAAVNVLTLKVNNYTAAGIRYRGSTLSSPDKLSTNVIAIFVFDGTYWQIIGGIDADINVTKDTIGSASAGTEIKADSITNWTSNTPTTCVISEGVMTFSAGTSASLSHTEKTIPNISVTSKTVVTDVD